MRASPGGCHGGPPERSLMWDCSSSRKHWRATLGLIWSPEDSLGAGAEAFRQFLCSANGEAREHV